MVNPTFHATANDYLKSLIRQRRYLIESGKSHARPGFISQCLAEVEKFMKAYKYDTDEKMAAFWVHHSSEIYALIPRKNTDAELVTLRVYQELDKIARSIYHNPVPWWEELLQFSAN